MRPFAFALAILTLIGCESPPPTPRTYTVSAAALVRIYRDKTGDKIYTGQRVRIYLPERGYKVVGEEIHWHIDPTSLPALVIATDPPPDNLSALVVEGTCRGIVRDGRLRTFGVDYYVLVSDARITIRSPAASGP